MNVSIVGLGKLGLCLAACFARNDLDTIGVDINLAFVNAVNSGKAPFYEPGLQEILALAKGRLHATCDFQEAIKKTDITFLALPTPSLADGSFSSEYLEDALRSLALILKNENKRYHLFVIVSTVSPGTIDERLIPLIESITFRKICEGFDVCYNPSFIALGSVIADILHPDLILIGESSKIAGDTISDLYANFCEHKAHVARMSVVSAEIAKISLNVFITMKISFANALGVVCEGIAGADVAAITGALGADRRVSPHFLRCAFPYGGPCFPRDTKAFISFARRRGHAAPLAQAADEINNMQKELILNKIMQYAGAANGSLSVLGLSYKPFTSAVQGSFAIEIIEVFLKKHFKVAVYDPLAIDHAREYFGDKVTYASSAQECSLSSPVCVIATPHGIFTEADNTYFAYHPTVVIDCWRILDPSKLGAGVLYVT